MKRQTFCSWEDTLAVMCDLLTRNAIFAIEKGPIAGWTFILAENQEEAEFMIRNGDAMYIPDNEEIPGK